MFVEALLKSLMKKKKDGKELDPQYKDAKMGVLKEIHKMASDDMGADLKGLKKVTVAAPDKSGLAQGLDAAKEIVGQGAEEGSAEEESAESPEVEAKEDEAGEVESPAEEADEIDKMKPEELQALIKLLEEKLAKQSK
jgi:cobalamin biosynthesis protein CobT